MTIELEKDVIIQLLSNSPETLLGNIKKKKYQVNSLVDNIPLLYYLINRFDNLAVNKLLFKQIVETLIKQGAEINYPQINWQKYIVNINLYSFELLLNNGLKLELDKQQYLRILVELLIKADIKRILLLFNKSLVSSQEIIDGIKTPNLVISALNYMYRQIGSNCRKYKIESDDQLLSDICNIEKQYINLFRLIRSNSIDLKDIVDVSQVVQMVFNSYLYHLIGYLTDLVDFSTLVDVTFYHYSNFPINNKIIMSIIYNDTNFNRIESLLREKMFIKTIIRKKIGKRVIESDTTNVEQYSVPFDELV